MQRLVRHVPCPQFTQNTLPAALARLSHALQQQHTTFLVAHLNFRQLNAKKQISFLVRHMVIQSLTCLNFLPK